MTPRVREQIKKLHREVSARQAETGSAIIVDLPIGKLKTNDLHRCLFVVGSAYSQLVRKQQVIVNIIKEAQDELTYVFQNIDKYTKDELVEKVKSIVVEEEEKPKITHTKAVEKLDKVTETVPVYPPDQGKRSSMFSPS